MKLFSLTAILLLFTGSLLAQGKYGATEEDSVTCIENLSVYKDPYMKNKQYNEAVKYWRNCIAVCPKARKSLYTDGDKMYKSFIKENKDNPERVQQLVDTLLMLYDMRIEHFKQEGFVLGRKGAAMLKYRKDDPAAARDVLARSYELAQNKMEAGAVVSYYTALYKTYRKTKSDEDKLALLETFPKLADVCEHNIANQEKEKKKESYKKALANIEKYFSAEATCEDLVGIYAKKFEADPENKEMLQSILKLFDKRDCADQPMYLEVAKKLQSLEPSADAAFAIAQAEAKKGNCSEAVVYYKQAIESTEDDVVKSKSYLNGARCYNSMGQGSSAVNFARKALGVNPNLGAAYIVIGDAYAQASCGDNECTKRAKYWAAYDQYAKAKSVDSEVAEKANTKMAQAKKQFPRKTDCFFHSINAGDSYTLSCWIGVTTTVRVNE